MKGNRHPITDSGLEKLVAKLASNVRLGRANRELEVRDRGEETVYGRKTTRLEGLFPKEKAGTYYCHRALVNIDTELKVPIKVQIFDATDELVETYGYEDLLEPRVNQRRLRFLSRRVGPTNCTLGRHVKRLR
jgi:hypothetical protein